MIIEKLSRNSAFKTSIRLQIMLYLYKYLQIFCRLILLHLNTTNNDSTNISCIPSYSLDPLEKVSSCTKYCVWNYWLIWMAALVLDAASVCRWCGFDLLFIHLPVCFCSCELHLIHGAVISQSLFFSMTCPCSFSPYPLFINSVTTCLLATSFNPYQYSLLSSSLFP